MKRILVMFATFLFINLLQAAPAEKDVASTIQTVKVFRQGAQVVRIGKTSIPMGETVLKFNNLSPDLDPQSIQLKAEGNFTILSVSHQINYLQEIEKSEAYQKLVVERDALQGRIDREQINLQVLTEEENLILANKNVGGTEGMSVEKLKSVAEYYRTRLSEIKLKKLEINASVKKIQEDLAKIQRQINDMSARINQPTSEILIKIQAKAAAQGDFELGYLVRSAGWYPAYDLRVKDISSSVELAYKANVFQNTGEDWNKVQLSLSTGNPSRPGTMPDLQTWWLNYYEPIPIVAYGNRKQDMNIMQKSAPQQAYAQDEMKAMEEAEMPQVDFVEGTTSFEFKIELPYDIPADGKQYTVNVDEYSIPAYYEYYTAPKIDPTAYLTAQLTNWEQYNLLNGEANLYFEGTYLGKSYLDVQSTEDTLTLSLGRDESVVVTRKKEAQNANNQFIGNKKTETRGWDIELRN
ncbi:MAG: DUF4139 domain-containing protein, partial [Saprospiraceae bacterium]|nr:DUF4139 domain-containing protein [Saprospiraceae bacterium]